MLCNAFMFDCQITPHLFCSEVQMLDRKVNSLFLADITNLSIQDGLPCGPLLADWTVFNLLHGNLILSIQQLQPSEGQLCYHACHIENSIYFFFGISKWYEAFKYTEITNRFLSKTVIWATNVSVVSPSPLWDKDLFFLDGSSSFTSTDKSIKTVLFWPCICEAEATKTAVGSAQLSVLTMFENVGCYNFNWSSHQFMHHHGQMTEKVRFQSVTHHQIFWKKWYYLNFHPSPWFMDSKAKVHPKTNFFPHPHIIPNLSKRCS